MPRYTNKSKQQTHIQISRNKKKKQDSCNHTCKKETQKEKGEEKKNAYKKGGERERWFGKEKKTEDGDNEGYISTETRNYYYACQSLISLSLSLSLYIYIYIYTYINPGNKSHYIYIYICIRKGIVDAQEEEVVVDLQ